MTPGGGNGKKDAGGGGNNRPFFEPDASASTRNKFVLQFVINQARRLSARLFLAIAGFFTGMKSLSGKWWVAIPAAAVVSMLPFQASLFAGAAAPAIKKVNSASARAEAGIRRCGEQFNGQPAALNSCIADRLDQLARSVDPAIPPEVGAQDITRRVHSAARELRAKRSKAAGASVMNRARAIMRGLAAKSRRSARKLYTRVARVFAVAASVISAKG